LEAAWSIVVDAAARFATRLTRQLLSAHLALSTTSSAMIRPKPRKDYKKALMVPQYNNRGRD
jgi:hypothetical protein